MRKFSAFFFIILCLFALIFSYSSWKEKIQAAGSQNVSPTVVTSQEKAPDNVVEESLPSLDVTALTANMDEEAQRVFSNRFDAAEKVQILIVGSQAMDSGEPGYIELFNQSMTEAYPDFVDVDNVSFDGTSADFLLESTDLSAGYDIVVLEPFTLNNNGLVEIEREHEHIQEFAKRVRAEVTDAVLILQPPQPIYGANFYLTQIKGLEEFALRQDYAYINHWNAWPATNDIELKNYLTDSGSPAQKGAEVWATELSTYFIAE